MRKGDKFSLQLTVKETNGQAVLECFFFSSVAVLHTPTHPACGGLAIQKNIRTVREWIIYEEFRIVNMRFLALEWKSSSISSEICSDTAINAKWNRRRRNFFYSCYIQDEVVSSKYNLSIYNSTNFLRFIIWCQ